MISNETSLMYNNCSATFSLITQMFIAHLKFTEWCIWSFISINYQVAVPGLHITLGIFLKIYKLFSRGCRHLDYRVAKLTGRDEDEEENEELDLALEQLTNKENSLERYRKSLAVCTDSYYKQLVELTDENEAEELTAVYKNHCENVELGLNKLVCFTKMNIFVVNLWTI